MHRIRSWAKAHAYGRNPIALPTVKPQDGQTTEKNSNAQGDTDLKSGPGDALDAGNGAGAEETNVKPNPIVRCKNATIRFVQHTKNALCYSWVNILLVFVPVGIAVQAVHLNPGLIFAMNAIAIIPLAGLLSHATESVASRLGDTVGALLNVTFGNAVELIIFIALVKNEIRIVQASLLGSILANLLLILGMSFLIGGLRFQEQMYNSTVTQMSACLLSLSVMSLLLPTAFHASWSNDESADRFTLKVSRGTSIVLLLVYILYILFQLKSHAYLYASVPQQIIDEESHPGILADVMGGSSSSDSSSSDDSDDSNTSRITAKRIKKAIKRRTRRRSSSSSKAAASRSSVGGSATDDHTSHVDDVSSGNGVEHASHAIAGGDEAQHDADEETQRINEPQARDFEQQPSDSTDLQQRPKTTKSRQSKRHKKVKSADETDRASKAVAINPLPLSTSISQPATRGTEMPDEAGRSPDTAKRRTPLGLRSAVPALLSNTVFSSSHTPTNSCSGTVQSMYPGEPSPMRPTPVRRTNSMPARMPRASPQVVNAVQYARSAARVPCPADSAATEAPAQLEMSRTAAVVMLLLSTGLVAVCAEFLVDSIPAMIQDSAVSEAFIGLIILPIVGNAAEHVTAVSVAAKNKMDLSIGVSVGSSIQIAIFVTPLVVILGWFMDKDMTLYFTLFETICLFVTAFVVNFLVLDGRSNYLEGALLIAAYVIIAVAAFFYPDGNDANSFGSP